LRLRRDEISFTDHVAVASLELEAPAGSLDHLKCTLVKPLVVKKTQQDDVIPFGGAPIDPVLDVMALCSMGRHTAPGEAAKAIPYLDCAAQRRRDRPAGTSDVNR
jgi:hypothetical protein